jgi:ectoine hydroxylase-related dioxygenase (phytanoyl-CoA dioxygenase family)
MLELKRFLPKGLVLKARETATQELLGANNSKNEDVRRIFRRQGGLRLDEVKSPYIHAIANTLSEHFNLPHDHTKCSLREQIPESSMGLRWHQDYAPMQLKPGEDGVVCWVPLDPIDGLRPSMVVAKECQRLRHMRDDHRFLVIDPSCGFEPEDGVIITDLEEGDIVTFSPYAPHRTYSNRMMTQPRYSLDLRYSSAFAPKSTAKEAA